MAVERKYNEGASALVEEAWLHLAELVRTGATTLKSGRAVKLTDGECVKLCQWLGSFAPPRGAGPKQILDFAIQPTHQIEEQGRRTERGRPSTQLGTAIE